jgi:hypothetical protein
MKTMAICLMGLLMAFVAGAQESSKSKPETAEKPKLTQEELEARFKTTLTKATLNGRWCSIEEGKLGPEKRDRYTINSVTKIGKDVWTINARLQYGGTDVVVPIPVQVKWAGDTAVIVVEKFAMPNSSNAYSARVLFHGNTYAGSWSGEDYGGMLYGVITNARDDQSKQ